MNYSECIQLHAQLLHDQKVAFIQIYSMQWNIMLSLISIFIGNHQLNYNN